MTAPSRLLRFSLRTLFVLVTISCCWLGYELNWIRQRRAFLREERLAIEAIGIPSLPTNETVAPFPLALLGEAGNSHVSFLAEGRDAQSLTRRDEDRLLLARSLFPESYGVSVIHVEKTADGYLVDMTDERGGPFPWGPSR